MRASKNRSQGREGWCLLFHHPLRRDQWGKPLRVRRGLNTKDGAEADRLVEQMDRLLSDESYWTPSARERALREVDQRVVSIFFDDIDPKIVDPWALRDSFIPLPGPEAGYTRVQLLGSTGVGKTTLVRQLIGSDPKNERFPSTSTAKTTVCDIEIVLADTPFRAVVSFISRESARNYIEECVVAAVSAAAEDARDEVIARRLLEHSEQRFRLSYLLGAINVSRGGDSDEDYDEDLAPPDPEPAEVTDDERRKLEQQLQVYLTRVAELAKAARTKLALQFDLAAETLKPSDRDTFFEILEDALRENDDAQALIDEILDDVETRFELLDGDLERDRSNWPTRWTFESGERSTFIKTINRFSSNYAPNFGRILTPLVQGLRVAGRFKPDWSVGDDVPKLVLMDGEGIGHTPDSATSLSTGVTKRFDRCDAILLVDTVKQPMVAGPLAVLRSVVSSGHDAKLVVVFTHFDQMTADNLPNEAAKKDHVAASLDNAIRVIDDVLGASAGRSLRRNLEGRVFFVGAIDAWLPPQKRSTRSHLVQLLDVLAGMITPPAPATAHPIYDLGNLVVGSMMAARQFQDAWDARLPAEHWTRVKALARRLGYLQEDEYDTMKPAADLIRLLSEQVWAFVATPRDWKPAKPSEEECQTAINHVAREVFGRLHTLISDRLWFAHLRDWQAAYDLRGQGSGNRRKHSLKSIYNIAAPVPGAVPVPETTDFLDAVRGLFKEAVAAAGAEVL